MTDAEGFNRLGLRWLRDEPHEYLEAAALGAIVGSLFGVAIILGIAPKHLPLQFGSIRDLVILAGSSVVWAVLLRWILANGAPGRYAVRAWSVLSLPFIGFNLLGLAAVLSGWFLASAAMHRRDVRALIVGSLPLIGLAFIALKVQSTNFLVDVQIPVLLLSLVFAAFARAVGWVATAGALAFVALTATAFIISFAAMDWPVNPIEPRLLNGPDVVQVTDHSAVIKAEMSGPSTIIGLDRPECCGVRSGSGNLNRGISGIAA